MPKEYNTLVSKKKLTGKSNLNIKPLNDEKVKFTVVCDHSIREEALKFHNFVDRKVANTLIVSNIIKVLKLNGKSINYSSIPIETVNERDNAIDINSRMQSILNQYKYTIEKGIGVPLIKCSPKTPDPYYHKTNDDTLRFIVDCKNNEWIVVLIDVWHMFATSEYEKTYSKFKDKAVYDIKDLI